MKKKDNNSLKNNSFFIIMTAIALCLVVAIGVTFAWLTDIVEKEGNATIGEVGIEIYDGETRLNGVKLEDGSYAIGKPLEIVFGELNTPINLNLQIKNTGTIPGIVKCLVTISTNEGPHDHHTDLDGALFMLKTNQASIVQNGWVNLYDDPIISDQYFFNSFLNEQLPAGATKNVIASLTPIASGLENTSVFIRLRAMIVAYSGNAYQVDTAENPVADIDKPFGVLTPEFLEQWTAWK